QGQNYAQETSPRYVAGRTEPGGRATPRALIIIENSHVPDDRRVWYEALSLRQAGWEVTVLEPHTWYARGPRSEVIEGVQIHRFHLQPAQTRRLRHVGEYAVAVWRIWREVSRLARKTPFDVIQACNPPDFVLLAAQGQRRRGTRLIFDHHDLAPELYQGRGGRSRLVVKALVVLERLGFSLADVALVTNESVARLAVERDHKPPEDLFIVRNGPRLDQFRAVPRDPSLARGQKHLLVYVGAIGPQDGVDHALRALGHLLARRRDWHARILGDGSMVPTLRDLSSELGL